MADYRTDYSTPLDYAIQALRESIAEQEKKLRRDKLILKALTGELDDGQEG